MVDVNKALKDVVKKGSILIGEKQVKNSMKDGSAKLVVTSNNCQYIAELSAISKDKKIPIYNYKSNGVDLGYACGKSFSVSAFAVIDEGESNILQLIKKGK